MRPDEHFCHGKDDQLIWGESLLQSEFGIEDQVEELTAAVLSNGQLGRRAPRTYNELGSSLSLLSQVASCQWGCRGGDHTVENLIRRLANYGFAAVRVAQLGLYNESLALVRSAAELANLLELFTIQRPSLALWSNLESRDRRRQFGPARVRKLIEATGNRPVVDRDVYGALCELGIHVTPESARLSHQLDETVYVGGEFSPLAFILVLNELAVILSACLKLVGHLIDAPEDRVALLTAAGEELEHCSTSWLRVTNYENRMEVDEVAELSHDPESNPVFLNVLHDRGVAVIVRDLPTIEVAGSTQLRLYVYQEDGVVIVPLFSTLKKANRFMESVPGTERANLSSLKLVINPILASDSDGCTVILNPKTEYERVLSTDDVVTLRSYNH